MSVTLQWSLILGALIPPLIAVLQRPHFPRQLRVVIMIVACLVAGVVQLAIQGQLGESFRAAVVHALVIIGAAVTFYEHVWKHGGVAPAIERVTTPKRHRRT